MDGRRIRHGAGAVLGAVAAFVWDKVAHHHAGTLR